jgi:hypothetical protein
MTIFFVIKNTHKGIFVFKNRSGGSFINMKKDTLILFSLINVQFLGLTNYVDVFIAKY